MYIVLKLFNNFEEYSKNIMNKTVLFEGSKEDCQKFISENKNKYETSLVIVNEDEES